MNGNTVLITGISGFIANHCAVELLNAGYRVRGSLRSFGRAEAVKDTLAKHADVTNLELAEARSRVRRGLGRGSRRLCPRVACRLSLSGEPA